MSIMMGWLLIFFAPALSNQELKVTYSADDFDVIVLTLKSYHTESSIKEFKGWLRKGSVPLLSLQNGVDNENCLAKHVGKYKYWCSRYLYF